MCVHANFMQARVWLCMHLACSTLTPKGSTDSTGADTTEAASFSSIVCQWSGATVCTGTSTLFRRLGDN